MAGMRAVSHEQLAKLLGLSPPTISMWPAGKRSASADALLAVGGFFEIDPVALSDDDFAEPLPLLAQPERFTRIEAKIKRGHFDDRLKVGKAHVRQLQRPNHTSTVMRNHAIIL
jgi:transcriptional regulator with XRE-family HTH domain